MNNPSEKPKSSTAWSITWAAILDFIAFGFLIAGNADLSTLVLFGACEALFIFLSVKAWKTYFEAYTHYEINQAMKD